MRFERLIWLWLILTVALGWEYWALNYIPRLSLLVSLQQQLPEFKDFNLTTAPGKTISYALGWAGLTIMLLTNFYVLRKRLSVMQNLGKLEAWLDYHIFCGLFGPTLIVFHSDFKVGGLVAISFWSMMISVASGAVGRYFFVKVGRTKAQLEHQSEAWSKKLTDALKRNNIASDSPEFEETRQRFFRFVGTPEVKIDFLTALWGSLVSDFRAMFFAIPEVVSGWPPETRKYLYFWAISARDVQLLDPFRRALGYWHAFHFPFTMLMYITAIIHVAVALLFGV
ncbi:MAG: hypothetical protein IT288_12555 [Bdellovibrionales bacterium]|nr:hypothetical protein [Bdellovibrionales bacterium]